MTASGPSGWHSGPDLFDDGARAAARDVDGVIDAEFFGDREPPRHGIKPDHAARTARFRHGGAVQTEKAEALNDDGVAQRNFRGFRHRRHRRHAAIERRRLFIAQIGREF